MSGRANRPAPPFLRKRVQRTGHFDRVWRVLGIGAACAAVYTLAFGESGWFSLSHQEAEVESLEEQIESLQQAQGEIRMQLENLEEPAGFELERVARDEYGLVREGEKVLHVVEATEAP
jgi:cell division protein FtsB